MKESVFKAPRPGLVLKVKRCKCGINGQVLTTLGMFVACEDRREIFNLLTGWILH